MNSNKKIELLAPAGNMDALHAAVCGGADAVYLGLDHFNARRGADNFTFDNLEDACDYAHLRGVKIYMTINIIIFDNELDRAVDYAARALKCGVDAFIVQDVGLAAQIHECLPQARLHISTQMNIHDEVGLRAVAALGAKRVVLARETSLLEIENLCKVAAELGVEIEVFGHGALCVCYSGQCMMSSMIGSRSANRGTCAQACRLNYELCGGSWHLGAAQSGKDENRGSYLLSPKDLCTIDILPQLAKAGVTSLKIEGRMKSPDYVYGVVSVYKTAIERLHKQGAEDYFVDEAELKRLKEVFSRGFTTAYLEGHRGNEIMGYSRPNNRGVSIGRVDFVAKNKLLVKSKEKIEAGDILEIWTKRGKASIKVDKNCSVEGKICTFKTDMSAGAMRYVRVSDRVFRLRSASTKFGSNGLEPKVKVNIFVKLQLAQKSKITAEAQVFGKSYKAEITGDIVEEARTKAITEDDVVDHVDRLGNTDFIINKIKVLLDENVGMGFSAIHRLRSEVLAQLKKKIVQDLKPNFVIQNDACINSNDEHMIKGLQNDVCIDAHTENDGPYKMHLHSLPKNNEVCISAICTNPKSARAVKRVGVDGIYVPALNFKRGWASYAGESSAEQDSAGYPSDCTIMLPTVMHDKIGPALEAKKDFNIDDFISDDLDGKSFYCDSLSSSFMVLSHNGFAEIGPHLPVVNTQSIKYLMDIGVNKIWLSPELSIKQIKDLTRDFPNIEFGITIVGCQELMITEHCHLMSMGECNQNCSSCKRRQTRHYLKDRMGYEFPVVTDVLGRSHIYNSVCLNLNHALDELIDAGLKHFMIDTSLFGVEESAQLAGQTIKALKMAKQGHPVDKIKGTTTGHLFRQIN